MCVCECVYVRVCVCTCVWGSYSLMLVSLNCRRRGFAADWCQSSCCCQLLWTNKCKYMHKCALISVCVWVREGEAEGECKTKAARQSAIAAAAVDLYTPLPLPLPPLLLLIFYQWKCFCFCFVFFPSFTSFFGCCQLVASASCECSWLATMLNCLD